MDFSRGALKNEVKEDIRGARPRPLLAALVFLALLYLISAALDAVLESAIPGEFVSRLAEIASLAEYGMLEEEQLFQMLLDLGEQMGGELTGMLGVAVVCALVSAVAEWTLDFGFQGYCLGMVRREDPGLSRLLCAFPQWGWVLLCGVLKALFTALWTLLFCALGAVATVVLAVVLRNSVPLAATLCTVVWLAVAGGILCITLRYTMADFILLDERCDALEAISRSKRMMRGRKGHLLVLWVSFVGWYLLVALLGGIVEAAAEVVFSGAGGLQDPLTLLTGGGLAVDAVVRLLTLPLEVWVAAYFYGAQAKFYDWLRRTDQEHGVWEDDDAYRAPYLTRTAAGRSGRDRDREPPDDYPEPPTFPPRDAPDRPKYE